MRFTWPSMQFCQVGEFESSKSAMNIFGARVQRVDHHLPVDRAGDLDASVLDLRRHGLDAPVALADALRLGQEVGQLAVAQPLRSRLPRGEQLAPPRAELALQAP